MAGQSPYVINAGLTYKYNKISLGLFYNVKGPTLFFVGTGLFPDVYTEPFHSLNFSFNKMFKEDDKIKISFKVSNIFNQKRIVYYKSFNAKNQIYSSLYEGMSFSLGVSVKL
jgi:outer membrane receptor protein involved in Fe transport